MNDSCFLKPRTLKHFLKAIINVKKWGKYYFMYEVQVFSKKILLPVSKFQFDNLYPQKKD